MTGLSLAGSIQHTVVDSLCLRDNPLQDPAQRSVWTYLPPQYEDNNRRFPVVMLLPAFGSSARSLLNVDLWHPNVVQRFDRLIQRGECPPALLVLPDAGNRWRGSQFIDAPASGRYQTFLADEVFDHVDAHYRSIPKRDARAVAGRSSGGFGALRMAMQRADRIAAIASHAGDAAFEISLKPLFVPAAIAFEDAGGISAFVEQLRIQGPKSQHDYEACFLLASVYAYADEAIPSSDLISLPFCRKRIEINDGLWDRWIKHDPLHRMYHAFDALKSMSLVFLDAGQQDEYGLQFAARRMADVMQAEGIAVHHEAFSGSHRGTRWRFDVSLPKVINALAQA